VLWYKFNLIPLRFKLTGQKKMGAGGERRVWRRCLAGKSNTAHQYKGPSKESYKWKISLLDFILVPQFSEKKQQISLVIAED